VAHIVAIDDDPTMLQLYDAALRRAGYTSSLVSSRVCAIDTIQTEKCELILLDTEIGGASGIDLLRQMRVRGIRVPVVVVTGGGSARVAVEAMRLGVVDYIEKPVVVEELIKLIDGIVAEMESEEQGTHNSGESQAHAAARWACAVVRAVRNSTDPKTIREWSKCAGASSGTLRNWCHTASLPAKRSLDFARVLRAVIRHGITGESPENLLNVVDSRTLIKLLSLGRGSGQATTSLPVDIDEFFRTQCWIKDSTAIAEVRRELKARGGL
jgi:FixJ family two-component response regulator